MEMYQLAKEILIETEKGIKRRNIILNCMTLIIDHYKAILPPFSVFIFLKKSCKRSLLPDDIFPEPLDGFFKIQMVFCNKV